MAPVIGFASPHALFAPPQAGFPTVGTGHFSTPPRRHATAATLIVDVRTHTYITYEVVIHTHTQALCEWMIQKQAPATNHGSPYNEGIPVSGIDRHAGRAKELEGVLVLVVMYKICLGQGTVGLRWHCSHACPSCA